MTPGRPGRATLAQSSWGMVARQPPAPDPLVQHSWGTAKQVLLLTGLFMNLRVISSASGGSVAENTPTCTRPDTLVNRGGASHQDQCNATGTGSCMHWTAPQHLPWNLAACQQVGQGTAKRHAVALQRQAS